MKGRHTQPSGNTETEQVKRQYGFSSVWVSCSCYNKVPQTGWLKTTEIHSLTVLEGENLESRCWQGHIPSKGPKEGNFLNPSNFWWLPAALASLGCLPCLYLHMAFFPMSSNPSSQGHQSLNLGFTLIHYDLILIQLHLHRPYFQIRQHSQVTRLGLQYILWGAKTQPTTVHKTWRPGNEPESWSLSSHVS